MSGLLLTLFMIAPLLGEFNKIPDTPLSFSKLAFIGLITLVVANRPAPILKTHLKIYALIIWFVIASLVSVLRSEVPVSHTSMLYSIAGYMGLFFVVANFKCHRHFFWLIIATSVLIAFCFVQFFTGLIFFPERLGWPSLYYFDYSLAVLGLRHNPNATAAAVMPGACFALVYLLYLSKNIWQQLFFFLVSLASIFTILMTCSRGALLALFLGYSIILGASFWSDRLKRRLVVKTSGLMALGVITWGFIVPLHSVEMFAGHKPLAFYFMDKPIYLAVAMSSVYGVPILPKDKNLLTPTKDLSLKARVDVIKVPLEMFLSSPLIGIGFDRLKKRTTGLIPNTAKEFSIGAHNNYLGIAAEMGLMGLIPFCALTFFAFFKGMKSLHEITKSPLSIAAFSSFVAILFFGLFHQNYVNGTFWYFMLLLIV